MKILLGANKSRIRNRIEGRGHIAKTAAAPEVRNLPGTDAEPGKICRFLWQNREQQTINYA